MNFHFELLVQMDRNAIKTLLILNKKKKVDNCAIREFKWNGLLIVLIDCDESLCH